MDESVRVGSAVKWSGVGKFAIHSIVIKARSSKFTTSYPNLSSDYTTTFPFHSPDSHATTSQLFPSTIEVSLRLGIISSTDDKEGICR